MELTQDVAGLKHLFFAGGDPFRAEDDEASQCNGSRQPYVLFASAAEPTLLEHAKQILVGHRVSEQQWPAAVYCTPS